MLLFKIYYHCFLGSLQIVQVKIWTRCLEIFNFNEFSQHKLFSFLKAYVMFIAYSWQIFYALSCKDCLEVDVKRYQKWKSIKATN